ncbi:MAG: hypothetical protein WC934_12345, partial [Acidithiobacillus sp.]|uniref:hypothetical protein n=1 Tax=Acidithiobacillus sp. TaxID=1872118 RepID=UPI00355D6FC9
MINGKKVFKGEKPRNKLGSTFENITKFLHIGKIIRIDYELGVVDIEFESLGLVQNQVALSSSFVTRRSFVGGMPEEGTYVLCGFRYSGGNFARAEIVSYLPQNFSDSINYKLDRGNERYKHAETSTNYIENVDDKITYGSVRHKFNKLYPGDVGMWSSHGSDVILDENVSITNRSMCEIMLRDVDGAYIQNSIQRYVISDGQRIYSGMVTRNIYQSYNEDGSEVADPVEPSNTFPKFLSNVGKRFWVLTQRGDKTINDRFLNDDEHCEPLIEVREEIEELGDSMIGITEELTDLDLERECSNRNFDTTNTKQNHFPLIVIDRGTLVGYNENDITRYGKVLKSKLFDLHYNTFPTQNLEAVVTGQEPDHTEVRYRAVANSFEMLREYQHTRMYIDKEGHCDLFVGATSYLSDCPFDPQIEHPLGAGRSMDVVLGGSLKMLIDKNRNEEESLILDTIGQVRFHLGKDDGIISATRRNGTFMASDGTSSNYNLGVTNAKLSSGNNTNFQNKTNAEHKSLIGTLDGGLTLRVGTDNGDIKRKFFKNGFSDGKGRTKVTSGPDVRDESRAIYGEGDSTYQFHNMTNLVSGDEPPYTTVGVPITDPDISGHSADIHMCGNMWMRIGCDSIDRKSLMLDLDGSSVIAIGRGRGNKSLSASLDGSAEIVIRADSDGNALSIKIQGNVHSFVDGNMIEYVKGDRALYTDGQLSITMKGEFNDAIEGDRNINTQGNVNETITGKKLSNIQDDGEVYVGGDFNNFVNNNLNNSVGGNLTEQISGSLYRKVYGNVIEDVVGDYTLNVTGKY